MAIEWIKLGGEFGPYDKAVLADLQAKRDAFLSPRLPIFDLNNLLISQRDGDSSTPDHYSEIAVRHATQEVKDDNDVVIATPNQQAKSFADEVEACCLVLSNPNSTIAAVNAAIDQVLRRLRNV